MINLMLNADALKLDVVGNIKYEIVDFENKIGSRLKITSSDSSDVIQILNNTSSVDKSNAGEMTISALDQAVTAKITKIDQYKFSTGAIVVDMAGSFVDRVITLKMEGTEDCLIVTLNGKGTAKLSIPFEVKQF